MWRQLPGHLSRHSCVAPARGIRPSAGPADWHGIDEATKAGSCLLHLSPAGMTIGRPFLLFAQALLAIIDPHSPRIVHPLRRDVGHAGRF